MRKTTCILLLLCIGCSFSTFGQLELNTLGVDYTIDFESSVAGVSNGAFAGAGFAPVPSAGRLDSDAWSLGNPNLPYGGTGIGGTYAQGCGGGGINDPGGVYCFQGGSITGRALGIHPSNSAFTVGNDDQNFVELRILNNTGNYIKEISLSYTLHVRNDDNRSNSFNSKFYYPTTNNGVNSHTWEPYEVEFSSLNYNSPQAGAPGAPFVANPLQETMSGIFVKPGDFFYIRWYTDDVSGTGTRDEFGLDDIVINVNGGPDLVFYSQNSGRQYTTPLNILPLYQQWSTVPTGGIGFPLFPLVPEASYRIQNGHTVTWTGAGNHFTMQDLIIDAGGQLISNAAINVAGQRYINLHGDILCNGQIGNSNGSNSGIGFNFEPGDHTISGAGQIYCTRIRKSNVNLLNGPCNLNIFNDLRLFWSTGNCLYNDRDASAGGTNTFNVTVENGATVSVDGWLGMDQNNPASNSNESGGSYVVNGTLNVNLHLFLCTNNATIPCSFTIGNGGVVNTGTVRSDPSGPAGHQIMIDDGGLLNFTGDISTPNTWTNYSATNNGYTLAPGSIVEYSRNGNQIVDTRLTYRNLVLSGSGSKTQTGASGLVAMEDVDITGSAVLVNGGLDTEVHGHWTSYGQAGFDEGNQEITFVNDGGPGTTSITTVGGEQFNNLFVAQGAVDMYNSVQVNGTLSLDARLDLNGNELFIEDPINGLALISPTGTEIIVSEDVNHGGVIDINVGTYTGPVLFPFGNNTGIPIYSRFILNSGAAGRVRFATYATAADNLPWPSSPTTVNNLTSSTGLAPDNRTATVDRFWSVVTEGDNINADVEFSFSNAEVPAVPYNTVSLMRAQRYDAVTDQWEAALPGQIALAGTVTAQTNTVIVPGVTQFSPWSIASELSPLPVEWLTFSGAVKDDGNQLYWSTASETDNEGFEIHRSTDGESFSVIGWVDGSGNSSSVTDYEFLDTDPILGINYYKLKQVDFDGESDFSDIIALEWTSSHTYLNLQMLVDHEVRGILSRDMDSFEILVFSSNGKFISKSAGNGSQFVIPTNNLASGSYLVKVLSDTQSATGRFIW